MGRLSALISVFGHACSLLKQKTGRSRKNIFLSLYLTLFWFSLQEVLSQGILTICVNKVVSRFVLLDDLPRLTNLEDNDELRELHLIHTVHAKREGQE